MTWRELSAERFNSIKAKVIVDVRSPCEFVGEFIPGAVNIPLLSDEERAEVGKVYKEQGEFRARRLALGVVAPRIPEIVDKIIASKKENHTLVVHCWRGGMRSEAVVSFLSLMGVDCWRLTGGYKAWRRCVMDDFEADRYPFRVVVVDGLTGVGKTEVLKELEAIGMDVLDLEAIANHRGSIFGGIGLAEQPTQKNFDGYLWERLRTFSGDFVFVEAESRKIGSVRLPEFLMERIKDRSGIRILLESSLSCRVERISRDYHLLDHKEALLDLLGRVRIFKERLGHEKIKGLSDALQENRGEDFIESMLRDYYDPLYSRHIRRRTDYDLTVCSDDPVASAAAIKEWCLDRADSAALIKPDNKTAPR